jgi:MFS family permease
MGLFGPLVATFMQARGYDDVWIGALSTTYYLCLALGSPLAARAVRRIGVRGTMTFGLLLAAGSVSLFPLAPAALWLFATRALAGLGVSFYMIGGQTALVALSGDENRARIVGFYALAFAVGLATGPLVGTSVYQISPVATFVLGGVVIAAGVPLAWRGLSELLPVSSPRRVPVLAKVTVPLHGAFAYGFAEAALFSLYPVFLLRQSFTVRQMGYAFSAFVVGSILSTLPMTLLGDRMGRLRALVLSACVGIVATQALAWTQGYAATLLLSGIAGAGLGPVYALTLALVGDALTPDELPSGSALFTASFSLGCIAGPVLTALAMDRLGHRSIFSLTVLLFLLLLLHIRVRGQRSVTESWVAPGRGGDASRCRTEAR